MTLDDMYLCIIAFYTSRESEKNPNEWIKSYGKSKIELCATSRRSTWKLNVGDHLCTLETNPNVGNPTPRCSNIQCWKPNA